MALKANMRLYVVFEEDNLTEEVLKLFGINEFPLIAQRLTMLRVEVRPEVCPCGCGDLVLKLFPISGPTDIDINELYFAPKYKPRIEVEIVE